MQKKKVKNVLIVTLLITVLFFIPSLALPAAVGNIDGLWMSPAPGAESYFFMARENGGVVLLTMFDATDMSWVAFYGTISGNSMDMLPLICPGLTAFAANITFTSATSAVSVITDCQPPEECVFPCNVQIPFIKIF